MLGTTNGEHRKLIGVETMSLFGYKVWFVLLGRCKCFRIGIMSYKEDYLMYCPTNKVVKSMYNEVLAQAAVPYQIFPTVLCDYRAGVMERRCGEAFYTRLSLRTSSFLRHTGVPPRISSLKPVFQRDRYEQYILYTTRRGVVSGVPLKTSLYVFVACSIWCQM